MFNPFLKKIPMIKWTRLVLGCGLVEAKNYVDYFLALIYCDVISTEDQMDKFYLYLNGIKNEKFTTSIINCEFSVETRHKLHLVDL